MQLEKLVGPVYDVEHKSGFQDIIQNVEKIKNLTGPVYDVAHSNVFQDVLKGLEKVFINQHFYFLGQVFCHQEEYRQNTRITTRTVRLGSAFWQNGGVLDIG